MRVLVSILQAADIKSRDQSQENLSPEVARLDRFSNGLLSRAIHFGLFQPKKTKSPELEPWCYLRPRFQSCGALMLWTNDKKIDWETLAQVHPNADILLDSEVFSEADLKKAQKVIGDDRSRLWPIKGEID